LERYHNHPAEELYDLEADPGELRNLAADKRHAALMTRYRNELAAWRQSQGDSETGPENLEQAPARKGKAPVAPYVFLD